jgi:hypothetical protein
MLLSYQTRHVQHLQKALTQMNVQLHHVITDLMGVTGQAIVRAIVGGERDARTLAAMRDRRIKADESEIAASLQGNWRDEHLFAMKRALALVDAYSEQIRQCDGELERLLQALKVHALPEEGLGARKRGTPAKNAPRFDARTALFEASGVDLTRIPGIDTSTALKVISEIGPDLQRFPTVKHITSWLGLCPGTKISGGKVLSSATKRCANRAAQALRMAAQALRKSQSPWSPTTAASAPAWTAPRPSPPPPTSSHASFTSCSPRARITSMLDSNTTKTATANVSCKLSPSVPSRLAFNLSLPMPQHE